MKTLPFLAVALTTFAAACGDDSSESSTSGTGGGSGTTSSATAGSTTTSSGAATTSAATTSGTGGDTGAGGAPGTGGATGSGGATGAGGAGTGGSAPACDALPTSEVVAIEVTSLFSGSEDIAFDGAGSLFGKDGANLVRLLPDGGTFTSEIAAPLTEGAFGLRFSPSGDLFIALPGSGKIVVTTPNPPGQGPSTVTDFKSGLGTPNGVHVDSAGNLWVTEFGAGRVIRIDPGGDSTTIASGVAAPNGVVLDETRDILFFTSYSAGQLLRTDPAGGGEVVLVGSIGGTALDSLALDACGNVYAVDQGGSRLYRFDLDASGTLIGDPVLLAVLPDNVANAQFGAGPGWNATSLYAAGTPGVVYEVPVGVGAGH